MWRCLLLCLCLTTVLTGCSNPVDPYAPPDDLYGDLSVVITQNGKYYVPITEGQREQVSGVCVRWSVGTFTYPDGRTEPIMTYWQNTTFEVGRQFVTIPLSNVNNSAAVKEYWVKLD